MITILVYVVNENSMWEGQYNTQTSLFVKESEALAYYTARTSFNDSKELLSFNSIGKYSQILSEVSNTAEHNIPY